MKSAPKIRQQVFLGSALAGSFFTGYLRRAYAACTGAGGTYACSGVLTTTQTLNAPSLTVTTNSGFGIATAAGDAMNLTATTGGLSFTDAAGSSIAGANRGIYAYNGGSSALSITTTGTVSGTTAGVFATNYGTDLTIRTAAVTSAGVGIQAYNLGTGTLSITSTGTVTATTGNGIYAKSNGAGSVTITSTGTVTATNGIGVFGTSSGGGPDDPDRCRDRRNGRHLWPDPEPRQRIAVDHNDGGGDRDERDRRQRQNLRVRWSDDPDR